MKFHKLGIELILQLDVAILAHFGEVHVKMLLPAALSLSGQSSETQVAAEVSVS